MLKMICAIPEEIGWAIVGFVGVFTLIMVAKVVKVIVEAVKERMDDNEEWNWRERIPPFFMEFLDEIRLNNFILDR